MVAGSLYLFAQDHLARVALVKYLVPLVHFQCFSTPICNTCTSMQVIPS